LQRIKRYLAGLSMGRLILWFYFIWYLVVVIRYPDADAHLWLTAIGISSIIGTALWINTTRSGKTRVDLEPWPIARLYLFPFCVSSFAALVKGRGFFLIFSPNMLDMEVALALCAALSITVFVLKQKKKG
jgi:hypothetical protein